MKYLRKICYYCTEGTDSETRTPFIQRFACGVGHVTNDIMRQLFFSFRLIFFLQVLGLSAENAGWLMLEKKVALAISSPISAFLVQRINIPLLSRKLGRRKSWHLVGTALGAIFTPLFFSACFLCQDGGGQWQKMVNLSILNIILAFAACLMDIGHLSLIPALAKDQIEAVELSALRTTFTFLSGIVTYLVAWVILGQDTRDSLSPESMMDFTITTAITVGIGLVFALIFHVGTNEFCVESGNKELPVIVNKYSRKTSFIQSVSTVQAISYMGTDVHCQKEKLRNAFINSLQDKDSCEVAPISKTSFTRHFVSALLSLDNREETITNGDLQTEDKSGNHVQLTLGKANAEEEVLREVKKLPSERKLSILMSIIYELAGADTANAEEKQKLHENDSQAGPLETDLSCGLDNAGFLDSCEFESERHYPSQMKLEPVEVNSVDSSELGVNCKPRISSDDPETPRSSAPKPMTLQAWLKNPHLYKVAIIFTCSFMLRNIAYSYLPLFLIYRTHFEKESIAYLPLIMLSSAALSSSLSKKVVVKIGSKWTFILAALLVIGAGSWFYFISESNRVMTYPGIVLLGSGFSAMHVNALAFATELIGPNKNTTVVFGVMTFMSHMFGGATVITIQKFFPKGREFGAKQRNKLVVLVRFPCVLRMIVNSTHWGHSQGYRVRQQCGH